MLVVLLVAGVTVLAQLDCKVKFARMATDAFGSKVLALQCEFGVSIVVESEVFPDAGCVAAFALFAKLSLVSLLIIVLAVTGNTGSWRLTIPVRLVTFSAFHIDVFSCQWKAGSVVIELGLFPTALGVATLALHTQGALVHIILPVARFAIAGGTAVFLSRHMALGALRLLMLAAQQKVAQCVIKLLWIE
jgi:hypothetical protein